MLRLSPTLKRVLALFLGVFALYALTAQRGLGWGDSGEFQYRVLTLGWEGIFKGGDSFATAHPLYVAFCKLCCSTPFHVTLVSAFFGALAVALFYLLSRNLWLAVSLALSHGLWWLSTVSEVYTMSLCFFAAELLALRRFRKTGSAVALVALAALNGLHLEVHNLALLALPVYVWVAIRNRPFCACPHAQRNRQLAVLVWLAAASLWIWSFLTLGPREVLWGSYGAQVLTLKPIIPLAIPLNLGLGALSLAVPAAIAVWAWVKGARRETGDANGEGARRETRDAHGEDGRRETRDANGEDMRRETGVLFGIHFLFWSTYFIASQYTFILPSMFLAYLLAASFFRERVSAKCAAASRGRFCARCVLSLIIQLLLPVAAWGVLAAIGFPPEYRAWHPGRDDPAYFALPWHLTDDSASRAAALQRTPWRGYP